MQPSYRDRCKRLTFHDTVVLAVILAMLLCPDLTICPRPEYEFYFKFRKDFSQKLHEENHFSLTQEQVFEKYAAKLNNEGISESEITRRLKLLRT
jgi:hypothetical protein